MDRLAPVFTRARDLGLRLRLNEAGPLISLAALSLFAWAFVELAGEVIEGDTTRFDRTLLLALREPGDLSDPIGPRWFEEAARDVTGARRPRGAHLRDARRASPTCCMAAQAPRRAPRGRRGRRRHAALDAR